MSEHKLPAHRKKPKPVKHTWYAVIQMPVTELEAAYAMRTGGRVQINPQMVMNTDVALGCVICEKPISECWGQSCPGETKEATEHPEEGDRE